MKPFTINLPDRRKVQLTHMCDFVNPGLPMPLVGHIVPNLAMASLVGICLLCKAGCQVLFDNEKCDIIYNGQVILRQFKDPSRDLWTIPIKTSKMWSKIQRSLPVIVDTPIITEGDANHTLHPAIHLATFTHSVRTCSNGIKFSHQSLCNPKLSTLLKAMRKGFLKGCPNMSKKLILKYLNPSPAMAKGHLKRLRHGIRST